MDDFTLGVAIFAVTLVVIMARVPVGLAMLAMGGIGYTLVAGYEPLLNTLKSSTYERFSSYTLSVVPLFLLMGQFATKAGSQPSTVPGHTGLGRTLARRSRDRDRRRLRDVRRDLRLVSRDRGDHVAGRAARDAALQLFRFAVDRNARRGRDAGHPDPPSVILVNLRRLHRTARSSHLFLAATRPRASSPPSVT